MKNTRITMLLNDFWPDILTDPARFDGMESVMQSLNVLGKVTPTTPSYGPILSLCTRLRLLIGMHDVHIRKYDESIVSSSEFVRVADLVLTVTHKTLVVVTVCERVILRCDVVFNDQRHHVRSRTLEQQKRFVSETISHFVGTISLKPSLCVGGVVTGRIVFLLKGLDFSISNRRRHQSLC